MNDDSYALLEEKLRECLQEGFVGPIRGKLDSLAAQEVDRAEIFDQRIREMSVQIIKLEHRMRIGFWLFFGLGFVQIVALGWLVLAHH
jgi:hypothetical protein